ncbi:MAG: hypothetical protein AAB775_02085 [Patescibacteria group bacterium]
MKKTATIIVALMALGAIAYGISAADGGKKEKTATDPCAVDLRAAYLTDVPFSMTETEVATTILTQYLEALKKLTDCPIYAIFDYSITDVGNLREVKGDFMADVKFDIKPVNLEQNTLDTPETKIDGEWVRGKQATLGIYRASGTGTTTVSYGLAL